uniref:Protein FAM107B-like isoform X1 n=3 Tax=Petromyzon marinus TaxID=7757 RepID=A0AAJ7TRC8_PETMA|nr:protein FAM107B-like isoform X1 [Petromyzon marinus]
MSGGVESGARGARSHALSCCYCSNHHHHDRSHKDHSSHPPPTSSSCSTRSAMSGQRPRCCDHPGEDLELPPPPPPPPCPTDDSELIKPRRLVNPVKESRDHRDLHRELVCNHKTGNLPLNKPELQKVMEKRKWEQAGRQRKEEEASKINPLEKELQKRQQKLEQLELEQQRQEEAQKDAPEFVKVKGTLRSAAKTPSEQPSM